MNPTDVIAEKVVAILVIETEVLLESLIQVPKKEHFRALDVVEVLLSPVFAAIIQVQYTKLQAQKMMILA